MAIEMRKIKVKMNKPIYLGMSILDISKTVIHKFWYDYIKPKYQDKARLCYMDTESFIIYIKTEDFYKDISNNVEKWFDTSSYNENDKRPLPIGKSITIIGLFKDELGGKIMIEFVGRRAKTYAYLMVDDSEHKKPKGTKKCFKNKGLLLKIIKDCLLNIKIISKSQQRFKGDHHNIYT